MQVKTTVGRRSVQAIFVILAVFIGFGVSQGQSTASANATTTIISALKICKVSDLQFGAFASGVPGTITISPTGARTVNGPLAISVANYPVTAASFTISGQDHLDYTILLPGSVVLKGPSGSTLTLTKFVSDPSRHGTLSNDGTATLNVGGTLTLGSNQSAGFYSGSFPVTITYQ